MKKKQLPSVPVGSKRIDRVTFSRLNLFNEVGIRDVFFIHRLLTYEYLKVALYVQ